MAKTQTESSLISIIIPARNEEAYIEKCLTSLIEGTYPADQLEVFVIDGCSTDATVAVVEALAKSHSWPIKVLNNPSKTVPLALNIGIQATTGKYIARADAHSVYPPHYISRLTEYMETREEVDNVGGLWNMLPSAVSYEAQAIPLASSHAFGAGNASYRLGAKEPIFVDTVPFGFFRKTVFEKYGLFDLDLVRNQDDEFNHRIIRGGGKILLVPDVSIDYYARPSVRKHARMFYQYGYFKPLAQMKLGGAVTYRQFVPSIFVLSIIGLITAALVTQSLIVEMATGALVLAYLCASILASLSAIRKAKSSMRLIPWVCVSFWAMHFPYGLGYLRGILDFCLLKRASRDVGITR